MYADDDGYTAYACDDGVAGDWCDSDDGDGCDGYDYAYVAYAHDADAGGESDDGFW